ncbi:Gfo/Idh/MocA family oxidoreductase [Hoyosella altamirensis]|uniref:Myo-inositol 2-dehydrogenase/D-chiro-inositol 1-dehydrogenase n=1 Tax=Hoyosella altamirensis TaxID=616997 RepID=A0A839RKP9_9ACTN|nr:Gfo/Idh/MocA family oxidoreductase [Hoyosella altamirensis]MBB3036879.1 myo-inositol 2-dehydrogenase/D-chiro-inositol 1-dehydrogenase [Hoyosella altamirensis]
MITSAFPVSVGLIGAGRMGTFHAEALARRIPEARLAAIADPAPGLAHRLAQQLGCPKAYTSIEELLADSDIEAVVIATPARTHAALVVAASQANKAIYCEKPMAMTLEEADKAIAAAEAANVPLQVGFNRRFDRGFRAGQEKIASGRLGTPQLLRSNTRDPKLADPSRIPQWTIFMETLIHDFDTLNWLNPGAQAIEVYATADAVIRPDFKAQGLLDTAVVLIRYDNGAVATADASFQAVYGYDVRAEVFASAGLVTMGDLLSAHSTTYTSDGASAETVRYDQDLFRDAYIDELVHFTRCVRERRAPDVTGSDARAALAIALAAIKSVETGAPVRPLLSAENPGSTLLL